MAFHLRSGAGEPIEIELRLAPSTPDADGEVVTLAEENGALVERARRAAPRERMDPSADDLARVRSLADLIDMAGLEEDADVCAGQLRALPTRAEAGAGAVSIVKCQLRLIGNTNVTLDAATGDVESRDVESVRGARSG